jgi:hypothetical protein
VVFILLGDGM